MCMNGDARTPGLPATLVEVVAANIRAECALRGISQQQLAAVIGLSRTAVVQRWYGKRQWQVEDLEKVADYLCMDPSAFFHLDERHLPKTTAA